MISKVVSLQKTIEQHKSRSTLYVLLKKRSPLFLYLFWIASGTVFYALHEEYAWHVALYQSTSVGWAIGWSLPVDTSNTGSSVGGLYFSCFHNLVGVLFVGLIVTYIEIAVSRTTDHWMVEMTNRQCRGINNELSTPPLIKLVRWLKLHKDRVMIYLICFGCCFLCVLFGYYCTSAFTFAESCDMTLSTLSCGGYQGMPPHATRGAIVFLALFTNVAVPLFLVAAGTLASIMMTSQDEKTFYRKIASPLTDRELKYMQYFGIENGDGVLDKKEFLILIIIRIGNVKPVNVLHIHQHYKELTMNTGGFMSYASILDSDSDSVEKMESLPPKGPLSNRNTRKLTPLPQMLRKGFQDFSSRSWSEENGVDREEDEAQDREERQRELERITAGHSRIPLNKIISPGTKMKTRKVCLPKLSLFRRFKLGRPRSLSKIQPVSVQSSPTTPSAAELKNNKVEEEEEEEIQYEDRPQELRDTFSPHSPAPSPVKSCPSKSLFPSPPPSPSPSPSHTKSLQDKNKVPRTVPVADTKEEQDEEDDVEKERKAASMRSQSHTPVPSASTTHPTHTPVTTTLTLSAPSTTSPASASSDKATSTIERIASTSPVTQYKSAANRVPPLNPHTNPFVYMRQYSRQESKESKEISTENENKAQIGTSTGISLNRLDKLPTHHTVLQTCSTDSTGSLSFDANADRYPGLSATAAAYSKSGRRKFSSKKDRQSSYERTIAMLGKSKDTVLAFVVRNRRRRQKKMLRRSSLSGLQKISEANDALEKKMHLERKLANEDINLCTALGLLAMDWLRDGYVQAFLIWLIWLLGGALFYSYNMDLSFFRGFYMSVNVGYAIYWTEEEDSASTKAFSVINVLLGQLLTTVAMAFFAGRLKQHWYAEAEEKNKLDDVNANSNIFYFHFMKVLFCIKKNHVHCLSFLWLAFGVVWSLVALEWSFVDALYFSITSLSTGGIWSIPEDASDTSYFIVALFTSTGAPVLCLSGGLIAYSLCRLAHDSDITEAMHLPITKEELELMQVLDIDKDDGHVDITEYVMLMLIRIKAVQPELIAAVLAHFNSIDSNAEGQFAYDKILATTETTSSFKTVLATRMRKSSRGANVMA